MARIFRARYKGTCLSCGQDILPGQEITWSRRGAKGQRTRHKDCTAPDTPTSAPENAPEEVIAQEAARSGFDAVRALGDLATTLEDFDRRIESVEDAATSPADLDEEKVRAIMRDALAEAVRPTLVTIQHADGREVNVEGVQHTLFPRLLYHISRRENVYLYGPSQSGKSTAAHNVAKALALRFFYISLNPQTPDSRMVGFIRPNGEYQSTVFYEAYANGGVICLDEVDNASSSLLTTLNSALANGAASFPCGMVEKHKDCVIVATGNTAGRGGTSQYPERRPLDGAFRERFTFLQWGYDEALEEALVLGVNPKARGLLTFVRKVRAYTHAQGVPVMATPTGAMKLAAYALDQTVPFKAALDACLFKGIDEDTRDRILRACPAGGASW